MKRGIVVIFLLMALTGCTAKHGTSETALYQNPVFQPVLADPSVIQAKDGYIYAYGTEDDWGDGKGDRLVPIIRSKNLVNWQYVGDAFSQKPSWKTPGSIWAPDIRYLNHNYYLYYAMSVWDDVNPGIGLAIADHPQGPFKDLGKVFDSKDIGVGNSIDPALFVEKDGTPYLFWGSFHGIFATRLTKDGRHPVGQPVQIAGNDFEASYVIKRNGYYYYFGSRGTCCEGANSGYNVAIGRSKSLLGPYVDKEGTSLISGGGTLLLTGNFPNEKGPKSFAGPGHNAIITDKSGTDWIVYHAVDKSKPYLKDGATRRPLMIDRLEWKDGWPYVKGLVPSTSKEPAPKF